MQRADVRPFEIRRAAQTLEVRDQFFSEPLPLRRQVGEERLQRRVAHVVRRRPETALPIRAQIDQVMEHVSFGSFIHRSPPTRLARVNLGDDAICRLRAKPNTGAMMRGLEPDVSPLGPPSRENARRRGIVRIRDEAPTARDALRARLQSGGPL